MRLKILQKLLVVLRLSGCLPVSTKGVAFV